MLNDKSMNVRGQSSNIRYNNDDYSEQESEDSEEETKSSGKFDQLQPCIVYINHYFNWSELSQMKRKENKPLMLNQSATIKPLVMTEPSPS